MNELHAKRIVWRKLFPKFGRRSDVTVSNGLEVGLTVSFCFLSLVILKNPFWMASSYLVYSHLILVELCITLIFISLLRRRIIV